MLLHFCSVHSVVIVYKFMASGIVVEACILLHIHTPFFWAQASAERKSTSGRKRGTILPPNCSDTMSSAKTSEMTAPMCNGDVATALYMVRLIVV